MTRAFLLRHGETDWNANGTLQGSTDIPLNARGLEQAATAATALAERLHPGVRIVSSPLLRARVTAEVLASAIGAPVAFDPRLVERCYGAWEGMHHREITRQFPEERARWDRGDEPRIDGYETHEALATRMGAALTEHTSEAGDVVVVGHGSAIRMGITVLLGLPPGGVGIGGLPNAGWTELKRHRHGAWTLVAHAVTAVPMTA